MTNILNLPGLRVLDMKELDTEFHVKAEPVAVSRMCPHCGKSSGTIGHGPIPLFVRDLPTAFETRFGGFCYNLNMLDIRLNADHDLDVSSLDLSLVDRAEQVRQQLLIKLRLFTGEWFLDVDFGTPYLQSILGKQLTLAASIAALRKSILEVEGVTSIFELTYNFSAQTRRLSVTFTVDTPFGQIEVTE